MTDSQNETQNEQGNAGQHYADGSNVLVTRGTKSLPKGTQATVLGYDSVTDSYAVRIDGDPVRYTSVKAGYVGPVPERTFTESEVREALDAGRSHSVQFPQEAKEALDAVERSLF